VQSKTDQKYSKSILDESERSMTQSQVDVYCQPSRPSDVSFGKTDKEEEKEIQIVTSKIKSLKIGQGQPDEQSF
jgi:hypothetical protein